MTPTLRSLDHLVLTVADLDTSLSFYSDILGMRPVSFETGDPTPRWALQFGSQKINLHPQGSGIAPRADHPVPGSGDLCFLTATPLSDWLAHLATQNVPIIEGPVPRTGATGALMSLYIRDPDGNLIEIANPA